MPRPSWDLDQHSPGSDALAQAAAALAAISIVYETVDAGYALLLEAHARDLYACARPPPVVFRFSCKLCAGELRLPRLKPHTEALKDAA